MAADGSSQALEQFAGDPTYQQLEQMLAAGRAAKAPIFRVAEEATALRPEEYVEGSRSQEGAPVVDTDRVAESSRLTAPVVAVLDATSLRQTLAAMGLPVDGKISKLRERLSAAVQASK